MVIKIVRGGLMKQSYERMLSVIKASFPEQHINSLKILEIGCGNAGFVAYARSIGCQVYGADIEFKPGKSLNALLESGYVKKILPTGSGRLDISLSQAEYAWPFLDEEFDVVISKATLEHVENLHQFSAENSRVLRSGGKTIHYFPSRTALIEPHIYLPFAGIYYQNHIVIKILKLFLGKKLIEPKFEYMKKFCFYRRDIDLVRAFKNNNLIFKHYAENSLFPKIAKNTLTVLMWILFRFFRSKVMIFVKE
jgi:SAM-dependent methyltransferase